MNNKNAIMCGAALISATVGGAIAGYTACKKVAKLGKKVKTEEVSDIQQDKPAKAILG